QSSRVPTSLPDDPYVAVRQAYLVDTNTESRPFEDLREIKVPQPLLVVPSPVLPSDDVHLTVGQAHTLAIVDTESELEEAPSEIEESLPLDSRAPLTDEEFEASKPSNTRTTLLHSSSSSDSTTPLSPDHPLTQTSPTSTPTRALFHRRTTRMTRYRGTSQLIEETEGGSLEPNSERDRLEDGSSNSEEAAPKDQQQAVLVVDITMDEPLGLGCGAARRRALKSAKEIAPSTYEDGTAYLDIEIYPRSCTPVQTPASPEWSSGSLPVSPSSLVAPSPIASPVTTPTATISVDKDQFLEGYDRDLRELYTRSRAVRDEIFFHRYRLRRQVDARRAEIWQARYDDHRLIHDMLMQHTAMQREL
ncbi:hypothetical protein Tco_1187706, partial [Tanacetum coccineum]